jgi:hypothetical protein
MFTGDVDVAGVDVGDADVGDADVGDAIGPSVNVLGCQAVRAVGMAGAGGLSGDGVGGG